MSPLVIEKRSGYVTPVTMDYNKVIEDLQLLEPEHCSSLNSRTQYNLDGNDISCPNPEELQLTPLSKIILACGLCESFRCLDRESFQLHTNENHRKEIKTYLVGIDYNFEEKQDNQNYNKPTSTASEKQNKIMIRNDSKEAELTLKVPYSNEMPSKYGKHNKT